MEFHFISSNPKMVACACSANEHTEVNTLRTAMERRCPGPLLGAVEGDTTASGRFELRRRGGALDGAVE